LSANKFLEAVAGRRSYYGIDNTETVSRERIVEIVNEAVTNAPSAMNSQSARVVVLFGDKHEKFWEIVKETLKKVVPEDAFAKTEEKVDSFKAGYGTVLFYEDKTIIRGLENQFELYKDNFVPWAYQGNAMLQFIIWTALDSEGLGASLQHYNPLIDDEVAEAFNIDKNYKLIGQLVFGNPEKVSGERNRSELASRVTIIV